MSAEVYFDDVIRHTDRENAILFDLGDGEMWIPKSVIECELPEERGGPGAILVAEWYARDHGLS